MRILAYLNSLSFRFCLYVIKLITSRTYISNVYYNSLHVNTSDKLVDNYIKSLNKHRELPLNVLYSTIIYLDTISVEYIHAAITVTMERKWLGIFKEDITFTFVYNFLNNTIKPAFNIPEVRFEINDRFSTMGIRLDLMLWKDFCVDVDLQYLESIHNYKSLISNGVTVKEYLDTMEELRKVANNENCK